MTFNIDLLNLSDLDSGSQSLTLKIEILTLIFEKKPEIVTVGICFFQILTYDIKLLKLSDFDTFFQSLTLKIKILILILKK